MEFIWVDLMINILSSNTIQNSDNLGFLSVAEEQKPCYNNYFNENKITIKNGIGNAYNTIKFQALKYRWTLYWG